MNIANAIRLMSSSSKKIISDSFDRANSTTTLGNTDTGETWTYPLGRWGISSNQAYTAINATVARAIIDTGLYNCIVSVKFSVGINLINRLIARYVDTSNELYVIYDGTGWVLNKRVSGTITALGRYDVSFSNGDVVKLIANGNSLTVYINNTLRISATESSFNTSTKHGIAISNNSSARMDDFSVESI